MIILRHKLFGLINCESAKRVGEIASKGVDRSLSKGKSRVTKSNEKLITNASKEFENITGNKVNTVNVKKGINATFFTPKAKKNKSKKINPAQTELDFGSDFSGRDRGRYKTKDEQRVKREKRVGERLQIKETGKIGESVKKVMSDGSIKTYQSGQYHIPGFLDTTDNIFVSK